MSDAFDAKQTTRAQNFVNAYLVGGIPPGTLVVGDALRADLVNSLAGWFERLADEAYEAGLEAGRTSVSPGETGAAREVAFRDALKAVRGVRFGSDCAHNDSVDDCIRAIERIALNEPSSASPVAASTVHAAPSLPPVTEETTHCGGCGERSAPWEGWQKPDAGQCWWIWDVVDQMWTFDCWHEHDILERAAPTREAPPPTTLSARVLAIECPHCHAPVGTTCQPAGLLCAVRIKAAREAPVVREPKVDPRAVVGSVWCDNVGELKLVEVDGERWTGLSPRGDLQTCDPIYVDDPNWIFVRSPGPNPEARVPPKKGDVWSTQDGREWVFNGQRGYRANTMELTTSLADHHDGYGIAGRAFSPEAFTDGTLSFIRSGGNR